ncbi:Asparagine synthetase [glutamine-hydrolyzing] 3 [Paenibacillus allorhizoplanae]|uniref:asparagine synthase (glutamine-hydrolyzing) n=1 Tax=Paenibacillus allorhizoplanae TaxID=2905648 RepID=A0ABM9CAT0_9BACL|nr:asparagine synthase-related protein [Paenibacillus allorhizoplanae]CAH1207793.1 Asparagine synthetase [glutamine-hydrolyzing] 3 [Paenibacillus allorhizoplanae]
MSAITGIFQSNEQQPISLAHGELLMNALEKYPADDIQTWGNERVFLGCHAQWITPESVGEQVPYYDDERQLAITADAIIDNRNELFEQLQVESNRREGFPDSALILLAYRKWGEEAPKYLLGDYAFMIWDAKKHQLFGARDFTGSRTLYYHHNQTSFTFCTTIEPLLALPYIEKKLNEEWLAEFLAITSVIDTVDVESTVYKHIQQIPPSHSILVKAGKVTLTKYCTFSTGKQLKLKSDEDYEEAFRDVFQSAVTARLRTHRNVGSQLSGGLDSGSVVSFAARALQKQKKQLYTYSSIPEENFTDWTKKYKMADERPLIKSTVAYVGNIHDQYLDCAGKSALSEVDEWLDIMEMPYKFFENSVWIKGIYERAHQQDIGVLLNGGRGNFTISWGPAMHYYATLMKKLNWFHLYDEVCKLSVNVGVGRARILKLAAQNAFPGIHQLFSKDAQKESSPQLLNPGLARKTNIIQKLESRGLIAGVQVTKKLEEERILHFQQLNLWNASNTSTSKLSLRYKLQGRDPTNDLRVVRFCLSLPVDQYIQKGMDRALIRRSMQNLLPDDIRLNQLVRGVQGTDAIHRMIPKWSAFMDEVQQLSKDPMASELLNVPVLQSAISNIRNAPQANAAFSPDFRILMRSLIVYRFLKKLS